MILIKEIFYTLQGEGPDSGRPCIFVRTTGCNKWSGRESDRADSTCPFCDTDFNKDYNTLHFYGVPQLLAYLENYYLPHLNSSCGIVLTGGEPLLQLKLEDINHIAAEFDWVNVETNGSIHLNVSALASNVTVICSPKDEHIALRPHCFKILYPDKTTTEILKICKQIAKDETPFYVQPVEVAGDPTLTRKNMKDAAAFCLKNPLFRLSPQIHKIIGLR